MKKLNLSIRSIFVLCLAAVSVAANAQQVSQEEAANIALQFLKGNGSQNSRLKKATPEALKLVYTEPSAKDKSANLYVYNMEGGGFAIVSADARTGSQILGYSFDNNFSAKGMPDNVKFWLGEYSRQIDFIKAHQPEVSESKRRERLKKDSGTLPASVGPLLTTEWGQWNGIGDEDVDGKYQTLFNNYLPTYNYDPVEWHDNYGTEHDEHAAVGCVATAMAQILYYHATKTNPSTIKFNGTRSIVTAPGTFISAPYNDTPEYEWAKMKSKYDWHDYADGDDESEYTIDTEKVSKDQDAIDAVAKLMYDCAVSTKTTLGILSSSDEPRLIHALCENYGFSSSIRLIEKINYSDNEWLDFIKTELANGRPIYYGAGDTNNDNSAHAFVVDGYNDTDYLHINWGWNGNDNGNFKLYAFNVYDPDGNEYYDEYYNANQLAVINIYKPESEESRIDWNSVTDSWGDWQEFGYGDWYDVVYGKNTKMDVKIRTNNINNKLKQIKIENWNSVYSKYPNNYTIDGVYDLIIYWDTESNQCNIKTEYTKTHDSSSRPYWIIDATDWYSSLNEAGKSDVGIIDGYFDPVKSKFIVYVKYTSQLIKTSWSTTTIGSETEMCDASLQMKGGLYLGDFVENTTEGNDDYGTAIQKAGIILPMRDKLYYRIGIMPVTENTSSSDVVRFAKGLNDNSTSGLNNVPGTLIARTKDTGDDYHLNQFKINEGAYYVVAAYYDETGDTYYYYQYLPVFFSMNEKWDLVANNCEYYETLVGGMYQTKPNLTTQYVTVQQYKGGDLIKNTGDRLFRIKNPYIKTENFPHLDSSDASRQSINGDGDTDREDVYLYLYVYADNRVSLFPEFFEAQPLGLDWGCGEMMVVPNQNKYGEFSTETDGKGIIEFTTVSDFRFREDYDYTYDYDLTDAVKFSLQLPENLKNYLTLFDNEPYTDNVGSTNYYKGAYYSRELNSSSEWGTLMLPYKFDPGNVGDLALDFTFYELKEATSNLLTFSKITDHYIEANTPVVFHRNSPEAELEVFEENDAGLEVLSCTNIVKPTVNGWSTIGVYDSGAITDKSILANCYFFEGNIVRNVNGKMNLKQYRAYFQNETGTTQAKQIPVRFNDEEYTSLDALFNGEPPVKKYGKGRFNLQGQAVSEDYKGVIIENGIKKLRFK